MIHCMLDLETWGTVPGCAVRSIGAVAFDPSSGYIHESSFYANITTQSCVDVGLKINPSTAEWWVGQSAEARAALEHDQMTLERAAFMFCEWYTSLGPEAIWSHGLTFDVPVWEAACRAICVLYPWGYRDGRDTRTLFSLVSGFRTDSIPFEGVQHNALADARHQARLVQRAYQMLRHSS